MPQASGMPTAAQASRAVMSKPPLPKAEVTASTLLFSLACSAATSSWLMNHFFSNGLISRLAINKAAEHAKEVARADPRDGTQTEPWLV